MRGKAKEKAKEKEVLRERDEEGPNPPYGNVGDLPYVTKVMETPELNPDRDHKEGMEEEDSGHQNVMHVRMMGDQQTIITTRALIGRKERMQIREMDQRRAGKEEKVSDQEVPPRQDDKKRKEDLTPGSRGVRTSREQVLAMQVSQNRHQAKCRQKMIRRRGKEKHS